MSDILDAATTLAMKATGDTALHRCKTAEEAEALLKLGLNVDVKNFHDETPLHWASRDGRTSVVKFLLSAGASVDAKSLDGWTPIHHASRNGHPEVVALLLDAGAEVEALDSEGWTPLHEASRYGHSTVVTILLAVGANAEAKTNDGHTPLDLCKTDEMRALLAPKERKKGAPLGACSIRSLLDVVARAHTLLKAADEQSVGTTFVAANTALAESLYKTALGLLKTATE